MTRTQAIRNRREYLDLYELAFREEDLGHNAKATLFFEEADRLWWLCFQQGWDISEWID